LDILPLLEGIVSYVPASKDGSNVNFPSTKNAFIRSTFTNQNLNLSQRNCILAFRLH
jgi:hypothetical protein